jgi:4-amino-4-deoxy-L-arabinose transferase-like glycosyltransferase
MKNNRRFYLLILVISISLILGFKLRNRNYNEVPFPGESLDEYSNSWVGLSLIQFGFPVGQSGLAGYPITDNRYINVDRIYQGMANGNTLQMNYPWFDHPPMMGLISGGYSYIKGARVFEDTTTATIRKPIILMSVVTIGLTSILAYLIFGWKTAVVSSLVMATSPLMVINGRMVQAENGITPLFLLLMICLWFYKKIRKRYLLVLCAFLSGMAVLFKLSGVALIFSGVLVLLTDNKRGLSVRLSEGLIFLTVSLSIAFLFVVYGAAIDFDVFVSVFFSNTNRAYGIGLNAISELITSTKVTSSKFLGDGWPLIGWLGLFLLIGKKEIISKSRFVWIPILVYLSVYLFFGSESYGWYRIPFMPFLMIIVSWLIVRFSQNIKETFLSVFALLIPIGINVSRLTEAHQIPLLISTWRFTTLIAIGMAIVLGVVYKPGKKLTILIYILMFLLFMAAIYTNILRTDMLSVEYWYKAH